jgi:hypothetical protein
MPAAWRVGTDDHAGLGFDPLGLRADGHPARPGAEMVRDLSPHGPVRGNAEGHVLSLPAGQVRAVPSMADRVVEAFEGALVRSLPSPRLWAYPRVRSETCSIAEGMTPKCAMNCSIGLSETLRRSAGGRGPDKRGANPGSHKEQQRMTWKSIDTAPKDGDQD